ncbi:MAG: DNA repair exonuclease, partial [Clostridia bacterium]
MAKIIHAADLHLDSAFVALTGEKAIERRAHQRIILQKIVELGNEEDVDIILLAGDLFDSKNAYYETARMMADALSKSRAEIFISPGNHDPYNEQAPYRAVTFSKNVHVFRNEKIAAYPLPRLGCTVYGAGFTAQSCDKELLSGFKTTEECGIMVLHGEVTESASHYNPVRECDIAESGLTYLALGHVHAHSGIRHAGETAYAYSGAPEGRGFDETGVKGVLIGTVSAGAVDLKLKKISPYSYTERIIKIENNVMESVLAQIPEKSQYEVCRIILTGECERANAEELLAVLSPRFYALRIADRTHPHEDIWSYM